MNNPPMFSFYIIFYSLILHIREHICGYIPPINSLYNTGAQNPANPKKKLKQISRYNNIQNTKDEGVGRIQQFKQLI